MNIEKWIIAHFSPTGGTKKVADAIAACLHTPVAEMDLTKGDSAVTLGENDALMAVLPVFAGRVPQVSLERLSAFLETIRLIEEKVLDLRERLK